MKRLKFHRAIVAIAMMLIGWLPSLAHHFEINGVFYNVISTTEVEVTYKGSSYNEFYNEYNGGVVIPSLVEHGGFTYSVTSIGNNAFAYCESLTNIDVDSGNSIYDSRNDCNAIIETASNTLVAGCQNTIIPNSVTSIGNDAISSCCCDSCFTDRICCNQSIFID